MKAVAVASEQQSKQKQFRSYSGQIIFIREQDRLLLLLLLVFCSREQLLMFVRRLSPEAAVDASGLRGSTTRAKRAQTLDISSCSARVTVNWKLDNDELMFVRPARASLSLAAALEPAKRNAGEHHLWEGGNKYF